MATSKRSTSPSRKAMVRRQLSSVSRSSAGSTRSASQRRPAAPKRSVADGAPTRLRMRAAWTSFLRRLRAPLVRARSRLKNEVQAALMRNLVGAPSATDLFGAAGRRWLADLVLPADERETLDSCLRTIAFLDGEVERFEVAIARYAMHSVEIRRLVTIPGVGLISAATLVAVVDDC